MIRTFKYISLTASGTPQPVFGTKTTAAIAPAGASGSQENSNQNAQVSVPVADSSIFLAGDIVNVDVAANEEKTTVASIPDGTHVVLSALALNHASGIFVRLSVPIAQVYVQTKDGNTGAIYIGNKYNLVRATGAFIIAKLEPVTAGVQPIELNSGISGFVGLNSGELWFDGDTTGDKILPSFSVV